MKGVNLKSELLRYIVVLMSGTVIAQIISYLLAPVITRIYTPEEAAELGLYIRIISVGAAIATARYELALPIVKLDHHSFRIYRFAVRLLIIVLMISGVVVIFPTAIAEDISSKFFFILIPFGLALTAMVNLGTNWSIRTKNFNIITYSRVTNSIFGNLGKVGFGLLGMGYLGLILGAILGLLISSGFFLYDFIRSVARYKITSRSKGNYVLAKEFSEFPRINLPHTLMDLGRDLLMALVIWELFGKEDFGLYSHTYQMLRLPLLLFGLAIGQVFFQKCSELINQDQDITPLAKKSVLTLLLLSLIPFSVVFFFGEEMFAFVFGENWRGAGTYAEIMAPWFLLNFIVSPISNLPLILRRQKSFFFLAMFGSILMLAALLVPGMLFNMDIIKTLWILSISQSVYLIFVIFKIFQYVKEGRQ